MSIQDNQLLQYAYDEVIRFQAQQARSALDGSVIRTYSRGERKRHNLFGKVTPTQITSRFAPTPTMDVNQDTRWSVAVQYVTNVFFDRFDEMRTAITDVNSRLIQSEVRGLNRQKDIIIQQAAGGTAITGQTSGGSQVLPTTQFVQKGTGAHQFDEANPGGTGAVGLAYYKVLAAKGILEGQYGADVTGKLHCSLGSIEKQTLIATTKTSSKWYVQEQVAPFATGQVPNLFDIQFHLVSEDVVQLGTSGTTWTPGVGTDRVSFLWFDDGISLDVNEDYFTRIVEDKDHNFAWQLYSRMTLGGVRLDDKAVVLVYNDPTTMF